MMLKRWTFGALAAASAMGLMLAGSAGHAQQSGGTMVMVTVPEPPNLANYLSTSGPIGQVSTKVYEGLIDLGGISSSSPVSRNHGRCPKTGSRSPSTCRTA